MFTTPASSPSFDIDLIGDQEITEFGEPIVLPRLVPGGIAVLYLPGLVDGARPEQPFLTVIDHDGSVRWRYPARTFAVAPVSTDPGIIWVTTNDDRSVVLDLATAQEIEFDTGVAEWALVDRDAGYEIRRDPVWDRTIDSRSRLVVVDLVTAATEFVPYPPASKVGE